MSHHGKCKSQFQILISDSIGIFTYLNDHTTLWDKMNVMTYIK